MDLPGIKEHEREVSESSSVLLIKTDSFAKIMGYLTKSFGPSGLSMIYGMGVENGIHEVKQLREELKKLEAPATKKELLEKSLRRVTHKGWGKIHIGEFDPINGTINIVVNFNPFNDKCGKKEAGGCFFLQGYVIGIVSEVIEEDIEYGSPRCLDFEKNFLHVETRKSHKKKLRKTSQSTQNNSS